ncbi:hypothetical protein GCM10027193_16120 [Arenimonas aestuarii]
MRWAYLVRELALAGHDVHVLAPENPASGSGLPVMPPSVTVHRTFPGPLMGLLVWRARHRPDPVGEGAKQDAPTPGLPASRPQLNWKGRLWHTGLNWKGRLFNRLQALLAWFLFPDLRAEWRPWAARRLRRLLRDLTPDVVISSHEPATTIELGLLAKRAGFNWIVDMGDPVLAPYTPWRWRRRALRLERAACQQADHVVVTTEPARQLLAERHGLAADRCSVLTQGFDHRFQASARMGQGTPFSHDRLELFYTGSFYGFRRHQPLLQAVLATPGARLNIASISVPADIEAASQQAPESVRLLGFMQHLDVLDLQRKADVLVNLANDDPCQVPGKIYEYLGAGRPILHVGGAGDDVATQLLRQSGRGEACENDPDAIAGLLARLAERRREDALPMDDTILAYAWATGAARLDAIIRRLTAPTALRAPTPGPQNHDQTSQENPR